MGCHYRQNSAIVTFVNGAFVFINGASVFVNGASNFVYGAFVLINGASVFVNGASNFVYGAFVFINSAFVFVNGAFNFVNGAPIFFIIFFNGSSYCVNMVPISYKYKTFSERTRDGTPNSDTASRKHAKTVLALVFFEHFK